MPRRPRTLTLSGLMTPDDGLLELEVLRLASLGILCSIALRAVRSRATPESCTSNEGSIADSRCAVFQ
jgi:hypothetical protein